MRVSSHIFVISRCQARQLKSHVLNINANEGLECGLNRRSPDAPLLIWKKEIFIVHEFLIT